MIKGSTSCRSFVLLIEDISEAAKPGKVASS